MAYGDVYGDLNPATQQYLLSQYNALSPEDQQKAVAGYKSGNLAGAIPYLNMYNPGASPTAGYNDLTPSFQNFLNTQFNALDPASQQYVSGLYKNGNISSVLPSLTLANAAAPVGRNSYEALSAPAQQFLTAQQQAALPANQAAAQQAYSYGGLAAALPYLGVADKQGNLSPETQTFLQAQFNALSPALQKRAYQAGYGGSLGMGGGFGALMPYLGLYQPQYTDPASFGSYGKMDNFRPYQPQTFSATNPALSATGSQALNIRNMLQRPAVGAGAFG